MLFFTMRTPMNAGDCPTVPMLQRLLGDDLPELLAGLDAVLFLHAERAAEEVERPQHLGIVRLLARLPFRRVPLREGDAHVRFGGVDGQRVAREQEQHLGAVVGPGDDLVLVVVVAREREVALELLDVDVDADLLPLLRDHLADLVYGMNCPPTVRSRAHAALARPGAAGTRRRPSGQAHLVEQLVRLREVERPLLVPLRAGAVGHPCPAAPPSRPCRPRARTSRSAGRGRCPATSARRKSTCCAATCRSPDRRRRPMRCAARRRRR